MGWADASFNHSISVAGFSNNASISSSRNGAFLGTGIEYAFMPSWSAKIEYDYYDFGTKNETTSVLAGTVPLPIAASSKLTEQTVKFGINYKLWAY